MAANVDTLTATTLLYHDVSTFGLEKTSYGTIEDWASRVPVTGCSSRNVKPAPTVPRGSSTTVVPAFRRAKKSSKSSHPLRSYRGIRVREREDEDMFEDESAEREAAHSNPIKEIDRLASACMVRVVRVTPVPRCTKGRKTRPNNTNLPSRCQQNNLWRGTVVPTYRHYLSFTVDEDPWSFNCGYAANILQHIWNKVYDGMNGHPKIHHAIQPGDDVFVVANQRLTEWRSGFGTAALTALERFFYENGMNTDKAHWEYAESALDRYVFLYSETVKKDDGKIKRKGIFGGFLVIQSFASHFESTENATVVPAIGDFGRPYAALALAAAAAERALTLWRHGLITCENLATQQAGESFAFVSTINDQTGQRSTKESEFSEKKWGDETKGYLNNIANTLLNHPAKFDKLVAKAKWYAARGEAMDERALLKDDSDSDML